MTAVRTFFIIDNGKIMLDLDSTVRAGAFTLSATDTSVGTSLSGDSALVVIGAENLNSRYVIDHMNYLVRTSARASSTSLAFIGIDLRNTVFDSDSISGADRNTVSISQT